MKKTMKKMLALILAMVMLVMTCTSAVAGTIYIEPAVDQEAVNNLAAGFGVPEEQMGMVGPVLAIVNALGIKVGLFDDGAQVDLDLNGKEALTLGLAMGDEGATVVSTLFPNYIVTAKNETIEQMMQMFMANMPGAGQGTEGGQGGMMDMTAMQEIFGKYFSRMMEACQKYATTGEPVQGSYEFEGVAFDTMVPVTIDVPGLGAEFKAILEEMLNDEAVVGILEAFSQTSGGQLNYDELKEGVKTMDQYFPEEVTAELYASSDETSQSFYMAGDARFTGKDEPTSGYTFLFVNEANMKMTYWDNTSGMNCEFVLTDGSMHMAFSMQEMYYAFDLTVQPGEPMSYIADIYFMNPEKPLASLRITVSDAAERTLLPVDNGTLTVVTLEELMNSEEQSEAAQGLMMDLMNNGLGALMNTLVEAVPEAASLLTMMSGGADAGVAGMAAEPQEGKQTVRLGTSGYTIDIADSYTTGELTEEDIADDMVAYYASPDSLLDFDIYQFSKEGYPESLADFVKWEAEEYSATLVQSEADWFGVPYGYYYTTETYDGQEYHTLTYVLEDNGQYVEIVFWLDGDDADSYAHEIFHSLNYAG